MNRMRCALVVAVAAVAPLAAQNAPRNQAVDPSNSTIKVVGCVQNAEADGSLGGTPLGTSATPANAGVIANLQEPVPGFILTGARPAQNAAEANPSPAAVGTAGSKPDAAAGANDPARENPKTYALEGNFDQLAAHKGHRVEVTGTIAPPVTAERDRAANRAPSPFQTGVERLRVQTITMIESSCANAKD
jgi:hypothetical protein